MPRRFCRLVGALPLAAAIATAGLAPARAEEGRDLHVILSLTGTGSFSGQGEAKTLKLIEDRVNRQGGIGGKEIHFVIHDDETNPQVAVQLVNSLTGENVILGPTLVAECNAVAPLVRNGPVTYCFSPSSHPPSGSYVFSAGVSTVGLFGATIRFFREKGWTKLGLLTSTDASGQDADNGFAEVLAWPENRDVKIIEHSHFNLADVSVTAQVERMRAAHPDVFMAWTTGTAVATIFKAAIQAGYDVPIATSAGNQSNAQMAQFASFLPKQLYIPTSSYLAHDGLFKLDPRVEAAQQEMYETLRAGNVVPDQNTIAAWDPGLIVLDALRHLGLDAKPEAIRAHIAGLDNHAGIAGLYDFKSVPQRGLDIGDAIVTRWDAAENRWVWVSEPGGKPLGR